MLIKTYYYFFLAERPYSIGSGTFIELIPQEKHRRTLLLTDKVKEISPKTLSFVLRTLSQNGIIMYSGTDDEKTLLQVCKINYVLFNCEYL